MKQIKRVLSVLMVVAIFGSIQVSASGSTSNPVLKITEVSEETLASNTAYDLTVTVENIGSIYGEDVSLTLVPPVDGPIILTEQISYKNVDYMNPNVPIELTYGIRVDSGAEPGYYTLTLEGVMTNETGSQVTYSEGFMVEVVKGDSEVDFEVVPASSTVLIEDSEVTAAFVLENRGKGVASDVTIAFGDNDSAGIYAVGDKDRFLATFDSMKSVTFEMDLLIDDISGYTPLTFDVTYDSGLSIVTETVTTYVTIEGLADTNIIIRSIDKSVGHIVPGQKVTYTVVVENTSDIDATYVKVSVSQEASIVPSTQSFVIIDQVSANSTETVQFTLEATESADSQNYPIEFTVDYEDTSTSQFSGVYITNEDEEDEVDVVSQPRIIVTDFQISSEKIFVGDTFDIDFSVLNTSNLKDVRNLKVVIETATSANSTEAFMPINQSNSYFLGDLTMKESSEISMPMKVFANAEGKSYSLSINFEYEDLEGEFYTDNETINIPVYEKTELTVSDVSVGSTLDNGYTLEVDFYNTGKVDITNMMVDLEGDFKSANSNYYVGDFATGRTDVYDVEIMGTKPTSMTGTIVFTYDDTFGEEETFRKEFTIGEDSKTSEETGTKGSGAAGANVSGKAGLTDLTEEQKAKMQAMSQEERMAFIQSIQDGTADKVPENGNRLTYIVAGVAILIIGAITLLIFRRKRKAD